MPTIKQKKIVESLSGNIRTKKEILAKAGYSENMQEKPSVVLQSKGVQELLAKANNLGLNDDLCLIKVKEAITSRNIYLAVNTVFNWFKIKYPQEKVPQVNIDNRSVTINQNDIEAGVKMFLDNNPEWLENYIKNK